MKIATHLSALAGLSAAASGTPLDDPSPPPPDSSSLFQNPDPFFLSSSYESAGAADAQRIPTSYESAVLGRRILALSPLATLSTVFPTSYAAAAEDADGLPQSILLEHRPAGLGGVPIGLMDYIADCDPAASSSSSGGSDGALGNGDPTILAIRIATSFKNVDAGSNMSVSVNWVPPFPPKKRIGSSSTGAGLLGWARSWFSAGGEGAAAAARPPHYDPVPYSAANLPRFSLLGYLEPIATPTAAEAEALRSCFLRSHPDARYWLPGNRIHESEWVRLVVTQVYWIGGFGDRAYIGWIPVEEWRNVTREEWEGVRLPGEKKGWKEWSVEGEWEL